MEDKVKNNTSFKVEMKEQQIKEIVQKAIEEKLHESFNNGIMAGWDAAWITVYDNVKNMTSAKKIKEYIELKMDENKNRVKNKVDKQLVCML